MALTYTPAGALGSECPAFQLPGVDGQIYTRADFETGQPLVVMFICNHCPYVKAIESRLIELAHNYRKEVSFLGICANDPADHPEDEPQALLERWQSRNYGFPYLIDEAQDVAQAFAAVCTPDLYIYDGELRLRYRGRLDDSWRDPLKVRRQELKSALDQLLSRQPLNPAQNPSMGCSIKWKKGDEFKRS